MSNYLVNFPIPQFEQFDPLQAYSKAMTLRQMADERAYRQAQMRRLDLQAQQDEQELAEQESFQREYKAGMTPQEIFRRWPTYGPKVLTAQGQALTQQRVAEREGRLAKTAEEDLRAKKAEAQRKINQAAANIGMQAAEIGDPVEREQYFNTNLAGMLIDAGITPAEQFGGFRVPATKKEAQMAYANAYDPDKLQAYLKGEREQAEAGLKASGQQLDYFGRGLGLVHDQDSWTKILQWAPPDIQALLPAQFSDEALKLANGMVLTAQQRAQETRALQEPGRYVPYPESVQQQRIDVARAQAEALQGVKPPTEGQMKAAGFYDRMSYAHGIFNELEEYFKSSPAGAQAWDQMAPSFWKSPEGQRLDQAQRMFTEARLRKESGAGIPQSEYDNDKRTYFPVAGDSDAVRAQKKAAREIIMQSFRREAGKVFPETAPPGMVGGVPNPVTDGSLRPGPPAPPVVSPAKPRRPSLSSFYK